MTADGSAWETDLADGIEEVTVLAHYNATVSVAPGEDALEVAKRALPKLILSDGGVADFELVDCEQI